uniref:Putative secreted protein n=1 Tax=Panstrongylus lignarius TaxID=156445 RepID=A0A224XMN3_9HEMI
MYQFAVIILAVSSAFTEGTTVDHLRLRRTAQLETKHQDYDHTDSSSFSMSYDENTGGIIQQNADGSLFNQTYDHRQKESDKQKFATKMGNTRETGANGTGKTVTYHHADSDKESSKLNTSAGHKDIIAKPVFIKGPDGKLVLAKANETFHQVYNHTTGGASKETKHKKTGKDVETVKGVVKQQQQYDNTLDDTRNKQFKKNVGEKIVKDKRGNFSNSTYSQNTGSQKGSHHESSKGTKDVAKSKTTN